MIVELKIKGGQKATIWKEPQQTQDLGGQVEQKEPAEQWKDRVQWEVKADHTWYKKDGEKCFPKCQRCTECVGLEVGALPCNVSGETHNKQAELVQ